MSCPIGQIVPVPDHRSGRPESGCAFGCLRQNRSCRPGTPSQRTERAFAFSWGVFGRQHTAVWGCRLVAECGLVHGRGVCGSGPCGVAFGVCESMLRGCLPSGDCNFSCTQIGDNSGYLDARSLALPRYGLGVGRDGYAPTAQTSLPAIFTN